MEAASQHKLSTLLYVLDDRQVGFGWIILLRLLQLQEQLRWLKPFIMVSVM